MAFDRPIPATETAGAPAAQAAATAALEAVFARCVSAQMFTPPPPPPPPFSSPARNRASLFRFNLPRLRRVAARPEHKPLSAGAPSAPGEWASPLPTDCARPPSLIPTVAARDAPLVLQRRFKEECPGMYEGRLGAWHGSVWPVRCILASPPATAGAHSARTVPGAAFPAPPGRLGAG